MYSAFLINLALALSVSNLLAFDSSLVRQEFDGISIATYTFEGRPVWTDEEKVDIIFNHNKELTNLRFSTNGVASVISDANFALIANRGALIELATSTFLMPLRTGTWGKPFMDKDEVLALFEKAEDYKKYIIKSLGGK